MRRIILLMTLLFVLAPVASAENATNVTYEELEAMGAFDSINNLKNNSSALQSIDLDEYYLIDTMTSWDDTKTSGENMITMIGAPITYGGSDEFAGPWFYAFLFMIPLIFVYGKSKSLEVTSMVMLMMSSTVIVGSMTDVTDLPASFLTLMYLVAVLAVVGVLYSLFGDD